MADSKAKDIIVDGDHFARITWASQILFFLGNQRTQASSISFEAGSGAVNEADEEEEDTDDEDEDYDDEDEIIVDSCAATPMADLPSGYGAKVGAKARQGAPRTGFEVRDVECQPLLQRDLLSLTQ